MTGATIPDGADAVVPVEVTRQEGDRVEILEAVPKGASVRAAGGDVAAGATVLRTGERLGPAHLAVLASIGVGRVKTYRRPRVAIMSTGDELRPPDTVELGPGVIRDTNRPLLAALLSELGVELIDLGIIPDDEQTLRSALLRASAEADAVVTSGGVSMGEYDLVKQLVGELGGIEVWQTAMQPAKPFAFGRLGGTPFFGLPGNPVSVMVAFEQFTRPALLQMMGAEKLFRPRVSGVLVGGAETDPAKTVFLRVRTGGKTAPSTPNPPVANPPTSSPPWPRPMPLPWCPRVSRPCPPAGRWCSRCSGKPSPAPPPKPCNEDCSYPPPRRGEGGGLPNLQRCSSSSRDWP